ncbi:MAG TPA: hypothetical protein VKG05_10300, partial [Steroidobacteraceae bacterium]|nr:hypothetical protein [Steroidobacteraceae bacterium]
MTRSSLAAVEAGGVLRARLAGFSGFLRANGYGVGAADAHEVLATAAEVGILDPQVLRWSLKALLCGRTDEWRRFDRLFDAYFLPPNRTVVSQGKGGASTAREVAAAPGTFGVQDSSGSPPPPSAESVAATPASAPELESSRAAGRDAAGDVDAGPARHGASRAESIAST